MKTKQNFEIVQGDTANLNITVTDKSGSKILSGSTIKWVLWDDIAQLALLTKVTGAGITITSPLAGQFTVALEPADTLTVPPGKYSHECEVTDASGNVSTVLVGAVTIQQSRI